MLQVRVNVISWCKWSGHTARLHTLEVTLRGWRSKNEVISVLPSKPFPQFKYLHFYDEQMISDFRSALRSSLYQVIPSHCTFSKSYAVLVLA